MRVAASVVLTEEQKRELERCARGRRTQARLVPRARIVPLAAEGHTDLEIAERLKVVPRTAAPFIWTAKANDIIEKVKRGKAAALNCPSA